MIGNFALCLRCLSLRDREYYKNLYCGLCKSLQKRIGKLSSLALVNDSAFLALLFPIVPDQEKYISRCIFSPLRPIIHFGKNHPVVNSAVIMNVVFIVCKYYDDCIDKESSFYKRWIFHKFFTKYSIVEESIGISLQEIYDVIEKGAKLEKIAGLSWKEYTNPIDEFSARMFSRMFSCHYESVIIRALGRLYSQLVICFDAIKDYEIDQNLKRFNIFSKMKEELGQEEAMEYIKEIADRFLYIALDICPPENKKVLYTGFTKGFLNRLHKEEKKLWKENRKRT